jgi:hypothetical protein
VQFEVELVPIAVYVVRPMDVEFDEDGGVVKAVEGDEDDDDSGRDIEHRRRVVKIAG